VDDRVERWRTLCDIKKRWRTLCDIKNKTFRSIVEGKRTFGGLKAYLRATDHTSSNIISRDHQQTAPFFNAISSLDLIYAICPLTHFIYTLARFRNSIFLVHSFVHYLLATICMWKLHLDRNPWRTTLKLTLYYLE
jgi:hypothetical protein